MAQVCDICGKGRNPGTTSATRTTCTRRRWNVNLRPVKAKVPSGSKRMRVCTSCLRSGKVTKA